MHHVRRQVGEQHPGAMQEEGSRLGTPPPGRLPPALSSTTHRARESCSHFNLLLPYACPIGAHSATSSSIETPAIMRARGARLQPGGET